MRAKGSGFWNWIAPRYARQAIRDEATYARKLAETRAVLNDGMRVLEIGCGTGTTALKHAPFVRSIMGVDFSEKMIDIARQRMQEAGIENARFEVAAIGALKPAPASFEAILAMSILHLLPDHGRVIDKIYQMLSPGGYFISSTICLGRRAAPLRFLIRALAPLGLLPSVQFLSQDELLGEMRGAGFEIITTWRPDPKSATFVIARRPTAAY